MRTSAWLTGTLLLTACGGGIGDGPIDGTKIGNPGANVKVQLSAFSSDENVAKIPLPQALTTGVVVTRAIIGVEELKFVRPQADGTCNLGLLDDDYNLEIESFFVADLVQGLSLPELEISKQDGFCAVGMSLEDAEDMPAGTPLREFLDDARIYVEGARADGTPFVLRSDEVRDLPILLSEVLSFAQDRETYTIAFDVAQWFANVDLDGAVPSGGTIFIDEDNNPGLLAQFDAAVGSSVGLCSDDGKYEVGNCADDGDDDD